MATVEIVSDFDRVARVMGRFGRQTPFAMALAVNWTANDFQEVERQHVRRAFELRRATFMLRTIKINRGDRATKQKPEAKVQIDPERNFFVKFERGGRKAATQGPALSVPITARRSAKGTIAATPDALGFPKSQRHLVLRGKKRTVNIPGYGVVQRVGRRVGKRRKGARGKRSRRDPNLKVLWAYLPSVPIPANLDFVETARRVVPARFVSNFAKAFRRAVATARRRR